MGGIVLMGADLERSLYPEREIGIVDFIVGKTRLADDGHLYEWGCTNLFILTCRAEQHWTPVNRNGLFT